MHKTVLNVDALMFLLVSLMFMFSGESIEEVYDVELTPFLLYIFKLLGSFGLLACFILHYSTTMAPHESIKVARCTFLFHSITTAVIVKSVFLDKVVQVKSGFYGAIGFHSAMIFVYLYILATEHPKPPKPESKQT
eukprot:TRINITY_DN3150_c0_g1_i1.p1 TRINITY_DN3150_c0_g1~~TRINITY_DN3150_c0_g1_i1.p1  ORF type:complete len:136 (-),score=28.12 TRINITY_DN3150_c0_g1_i1:103-510(-)